jgi:ubiquitin-conjugating enzyme E2 D/E
MALKRILKEISDINKQADSGLSIFPTGDDAFNCQLSLLGPPGSVYESGVFFISIKYPKDYPFKPPKIYFETKIYHPNIFFGINSYNSANLKGFVCCCVIPMIGDKWSPAHTTDKIIESLKSLLIEPNINEYCGDIDVFNLYKQDKTKFETIAKEWTKKYAM